MSSRVPPHQTRLGGAFTVFSSPRFLGRVAFAFALLCTLVAVYYAEENWRGKRDWLQCRQALESRGANFDWKTLQPPPVPDDRNVFQAPDMAEWFVKQNSSSAEAKSLLGLFSTLSERVRQRDVLAEITVGAGASASSTTGVDVVLTRRPPPGAPFSKEELNIIGGFLRGRLRTPSPRSPTLRSAQEFSFCADSTNQGKAIRVALIADAPPSAPGILALFQDAANTVGVQAHGGFKVELLKGNRLEVRLRSPSAVDAATYLAWSETLAPVLEQVRTGLERPDIRPDGEYSKPWAIPVPNFVAVRNMAQVLSQRAQCYLLLKQPDRALRELTLLHGLRRLLHGRPLTLVAAMIDVAVSGLYSNTVADGLRLHAWREPELAALQRQLQEVQLVPALIEAITTERVSGCYLFENVRASELDNIINLTQKPGFWSKVTSPEYLLARWMPRGWVYQNIKSIALQNQWFLDSVQTNHCVKSSLVEESSRKSVAALEGFAPYNLFARAAMPNLLKAFQTTVRNQAWVNEAYLACALERYRLNKNEYPDRLELLVADVAPNMMLDPIEGRPLKYRRLQSDQFVLYSLGWNATDDGGEPGTKTDEGDWVWDSQNL